MRHWDDLRSNGEPDMCSRHAACNASSTGLVQLPCGPVLSRRGRRHRTIHIGLNQFAGTLSHATTTQDAGSTQDVAAWRVAVAPRGGRAAPTVVHEGAASGDRACH